MRVTVLQECGSTNMEARDREKYSHGDVVVAVTQTAGRGQRGHSWESAPGENLTFSLVLELAFLPAASQFLLSETAALAVADTLAGYGIEASVKWTNDIYVGDRKICGMLIENDLKDGAVSRSIVGIGINVNQTRFADWVPNPTSMSLETGRYYDIMDVMDAFSEAFGSLYAILEQGGGGEIKERYDSMLYRLGEPHRYMIPGRGEVTGIIRGVEHAGDLIVEIDGRPEKFLFKEIEFII